jgi:hypothetical protein
VVIESKLRNSLIIFISILIFYVFQDTLIIISTKKPKINDIQVQIEVSNFEPSTNSCLHHSKPPQEPASPTAILKKPLSVIFIVYSFSSDPEGE